MDLSRITTGDEDMKARSSDSNTSDQASNINQVAIYENTEIRIAPIFQLVNEDTAPSSTHPQTFTFEQLVEGWKLQRSFFDEALRRQHDQSSTTERTLRKEIDETKDKLEKTSEENENHRKQSQAHLEQAKDNHHQWKEKYACLETQGKEIINAKIEEITQLKEQNQASQRLLETSQTRHTDLQTKLVEAEHSRDDAARQVHSKTKEVSRLSTELDAVRLKSSLDYDRLDNLRQLLHTEKQNARNGGEIAKDNLDSQRRKLQQKIKDNIELQNQIAQQQDELTTARQNEHDAILQRDERIKLYNDLVEQYRTGNKDINTRLQTMSDEVHTLREQKQSLQDTVRHLKLQLREQSHHSERCPPSHSLEHHTSATEVLEELGNMSVKSYSRHSSRDRATRISVHHRDRATSGRHRHSSRDRTIRKSVSHRDRSSRRHSSRDRTTRKSVHHTDRSSSDRRRHSSRDRATRKSVPHREGTTSDRRRPHRVMTLSDIKTEMDHKSESDHKAERSRTQSTFWSGSRSRSSRISDAVDRLSQQTQQMQVELAGAIKTLAGSLDTSQKPRKFSGDKKEDIDDWLDHIKELALTNSWTNQEKLRFARNALEGKAHKTITALANSRPIRSFGDLEKRLRDHYGPSEPKKHWLYKLSKAQQGSTERTKDYVIRFTTIVNKLKRIMHSSVHRVDSDYIKEQFEDSLRPEIREEMMNTASHPTTLDEAYKAAVNAEKRVEKRAEIRGDHRSAYDDDTKIETSEQNQTKKTKAKPFRQDKHCAFCNINGHNLFECRNKLKAEIQQLKESAQNHSVQQNTTRNQQYQPYGQSSQRFSYQNQYNGQPAQRYNSVDPRTQYGQQNMQSQQTKSYNNGPRPRQDLSKIKCFHCGQYGHYRTSCVKFKQDIESAQSQNRNDSQSQDVRQWKPRNDQSQHSEQKRD
jgi:hypothetical protein